MSNKKNVNKILIKLGQGAILSYRKIFSCFFLSGQMFFPSVCKFSPSCSVYAREALAKYGFLKGSWLSLKRILKCNPFS